MRSPTGVALGCGPAMDFEGLSMLLAASLVIVLTGALVAPLPNLHMGLPVCRLVHGAHGERN